MAIDFDALVLKPCQDTFAKPMLVMPLASQPSVPVYPARRISSKRPVDIALEGGGVLSSDETRLGIRLSEFPIPPVPGDRVSLDGGLTWLEIDDLDSDDEGDAKLALKAIG